MTTPTNADYLRSMATPPGAPRPTRPGMYLCLTHGRVAIDEQLADWGSSGPYIGPLAWCHITYNSTINICAADDRNEEGTGPMCGIDEPLRFEADMLHYDGVYYGDWELMMVGA